MGWERRQRGGLYYVRKVRVGDKVQSLYVGSGELAALSSQLDEYDWDERQSEQKQRRQELDALAASDAAMAAFCADVEATLREALEAAGFYRHNRGEWRKRRG